ncbi:MAG: glycosyltransferase family 9 protein [Brevundimonas sp.]|nr:MAG: glycosyltransferase family 9 protein [Brevundimonas sp.]
MPGAYRILYVAEADPEAAVLSSGALAYLVEAMPRARFTVVGSPASAPLFADLPRLDRLIVMEGESTGDWFTLWNQVRTIDWGLVVDLRGSTLWKRLTRQKRALKVTPNPGEHAVEAAARAVQFDETPPPRLHTSDETEAQVAELIPPGDGPILAVGPGVDWMGKRWPAERFAKVAGALLADDGPLAGGRLMIVGDETDRDEAHTIRLAAPRKRVIELQGKLTPLQTVAAVRRARLFLGADSLWTQLAVASGVPVLAVFGPSDDVWKGPWGGVTVRGDRTLDEYRALDPKLNQALQHMSDLQADRVLKAAKTLLAKTQ